MSAKDQYIVALTVLRSIQLYENHPNWQHDIALRFLCKYNIRLDILMKAWQTL